MAVFMFAHTHRFGGDVRLVRVPDNIDLVAKFYNEEDEGQVEIAKAFDIDFEPDREEEELNVEYIDLNTVKEYGIESLPAILTVE